MAEKLSLTQNISLTEQSKERMLYLCKLYDMRPSELVRSLINKEFISYDNTLRNIIEEHIGGPIT